MRLLDGESSPSSGLAMRSPPSDCDRLRSPFIVRGRGRGRGRAAGRTAAAADEAWGRPAASTTMSEERSGMESGETRQCGVVRSGTVPCRAMRLRWPSRLESVRPACGHAPALGHVLGPSPSTPSTHSPHSRLAPIPIDVFRGHRLHGSPSSVVLACLATASTTGERAWPAGAVRHAPSSSSCRPRPPIAVAALSCGRHGHPSASGESLLVELDIIFHSRSLAPIRFTPLAQLAVGTTCYA